MSEQVLAEEIWKAIPQFEGLYSVSNLGRIMSHKRLYVRGGPVKPWPIRGGYLAVDLGYTRAQKVHRLVLITFVGNPPEGMNDANHKNGIVTDNRLTNLEWCSRSSNTRHALQVLGRRKCPGAQGSRNAGAKLTEDQVRHYRNLAKTGVTYRQIAHLAGLHYESARKMLRGDTWAHIIKTTAA